MTATTATSHPHGRTPGTFWPGTTRPGVRATTVASNAVMSYIQEDDPWVLAFYHQNELRYVEPGNEAEIFLETYPNRIIKCKVDSIMWATAQGQLPIGTMNGAGGVAPVPPGCLAVRLLKEGKDEDLFLAAGARGAGAIYTDSGHMIHIIRKVVIRVGAKLDWLILKLH